MRVRLFSSGLLTVGLLCGGLSSEPAQAKKRAVAQTPTAPAPQAGEQTTRAVSELSGKFKWGMTSAEVMDIMEKDLRAKFEPTIRAESDPFRQDLIRKDMMDTVEKMRSSYVKFDGQKTGWDVSVVDREFGHKNSESMVTLWETNQRRFLFFWNDKLYKQYIALATERFQDKTFDEFSEIIQSRYGKAQISFAKMQTQDEMAVDFLEWPPAGDFVLRAYDNSKVFGNYCLSLLHRSTYQQVEQARAKNSPPRFQRATAIVDSVAQEGAPGDPNADIVDQVLGRRSTTTVPVKK